MLLLMFYGMFVNICYNHTLINIPHSEARKKGIFAYDCELQENVMLMPWILAMAGDNPMQSEFASHIGLSGTCFCRVCTVRGADQQNRAPGAAGEYERISDFLSVSHGICACLMSHDLFWDDLVPRTTQQRGNESCLGPTA